MRKLLVAVALVGLVVIIGGADNPKPAQDTKEPAKPEKPAVSLKVGQPGSGLEGQQVAPGGSGPGVQIGQDLRRRLLGHVVRQLHPLHGSPGRAAGTVQG